MSHVVALAQVMLHEHRDDRRVVWLELGRPLSRQPGVGRTPGRIGRAGHRHQDADVSRSHAPGPAQVLEGGLVVAPALRQVGERHVRLGGAGPQPHRLPCRVEGRVGIAAGIQRLGRQRPGLHPHPHRQ